MSKGGSSSTERVIPDWLEAALKPLLKQSTAGLQAFQAQGQNVLHGIPYNQGLPFVGEDGKINPNETGASSFRDVLNGYYGGRSTQNINFTDENGRQKTSGS